MSKLTSKGSIPRVLKAVFLLLAESQTLKSSASALKRTGMSGASFPASQELGSPHFLSSSLPPNATSFGSPNLHATSWAQLAEYGHAN